jgi:S1-C subfamily serine protease
VERSTVSKKTIILTMFTLVLVCGFGACQTTLSTALAQNVTEAGEGAIPIDANSSAPTEGLAALDSYENTIEEQIVSLYQSASLSVVNITTVEYVHNRMLGELPEEGVGSGFVYDSQGHIVTNYHVIEDADELIVTLASGEEYEAVIVGSDAVNDLAVLYIDGGDELPPPLPLADSDEVQVGETVLAIGNPYGLDRTLTTGVVSALGRVIEGAEEGQFIAEAIQTDAAINPGNSGGPLLNLEGFVIGVNSQIISTSGSSAGVGFAISANTVKVIVHELIANGVYLHPWLGVETVNLTAYSAALLSKAGMNITVESGVLVIGVESGSPAEAAGIRSGSRIVRFDRYMIPLGGDIITAVDDVQVETLQDLMIYLEMQKGIGDTVQLTIVRDGVERTVLLTLTTQPASN